MAAVPAVLAVLLVFGEFLLQDDRIPSHPQGDTALYFQAARGFAAEAIRSGSVPLWNPHSFSGTPFVAVFQSSVFHLPAVFHWVLPAGPAFVAEFVICLVGLGIGVSYWLRGWGLHWLACAFGAFVAVFSGAVLLRVLAGQLTVLGTFLYFPLLLTAVDRVEAKPTLGWVCLGAIAVAGMALAGHPATLLMAGVAAGLYALPTVRGGKRWRRLGWLAGIAALGLVAAGVQLLPGLAVASETSRGQGLDYAAAIAFSMPPESMLTIAAPGLFGDGPGADYFGRWWYWDASAFIGCGALAFALHGAATPHARRFQLLLLAAVATVLALGGYTPIYRALYDWVPGFDLIRAPSKLLFFATLALAGLAALGVDGLLRREGRPERSAVLAASVASGLLLLAAWQALAVSGAVDLPSPTALQTQLEHHRTLSPKAAARFADAAAPSLATAGALLLAAAVLVRLSNLHRAVVVALVALGAAELLHFADANHGSVALESRRPGREVMRRVYERAGTKRVLESRMATNLALASRGYGVWGYDPVFLHRYAELIASTQGIDVADLDNNRGVRPHRFHPLLSMLRVGWEAGGRRPVEHPGPLPRALLVAQARVEPNAEAVLAALNEEGFDPRRVVILEEAPDPPPAGRSVGAQPVVVRDESTDGLVLEVETPEPAILLVTDAFAEGWEARPRPGSQQDAYRVLRANAALRAIPLQAGRHRLELVYAPRSFQLGVMASGLGLVILLGLGMGSWLQRRRGATWQGMRAAGAIGIAIGGLACDGGPQDPPNVVLYVVDTLRADALEPYGNPVVETPSVARFAREAALYERAYAHSSWTRPSIASILTGELPHAHAVEGRDDHAGPSLRFLAEALGEAGYQTGAVVTNPNVGAFFGFDQGFADFFELFVSHEEHEEGVVPTDSPRSRSDEVTRKAIEWLSDVEPPFFLFVLTSDPHTPYRPPEGFDRFDARRDPRPKGSAYQRLPGVERQRSLYYGEVAYNDRSFGELLDFLRSEGLYDDSLVVFTADHGEEFGEHGHRWHGKGLFEEQVRVPLVIRRPRELEPGRRVPVAVRLIDVYPTVLDAVGLPGAPGLAGRILPPDSSALELPVYARLRVDGYRTEMLIDGSWKLIESHAQPEKEKRELGGLFDLGADPSESVDRSHAERERMESLRAHLASMGPSEVLAHDEAVRSPEPQRELPTDVREALEILGYLEPREASQE